MTILYAARRLMFAVIGADRRFNVHAWNGDQRAALAGNHCKVMAHPSRPLAFGTAGLAALGGRDTRDVVMEIIDGVPQLLLLMLGLVLQGHLTAVITNERTTWPNDLAEDRASVQVALAAATDDGVQLLMVVGGDGAMSCPINTGCLNEPKTLPGFYSSGQYATNEGKFGPGTADADHLVRHVKAAILDGIAAEKRLLGENQEVGGGVDIVLVDHEGARLVDSVELDVSPA